MKRIIIAAAMLTAALNASAQEPLYDEDYDDSESLYEYTESKWDYETKLEKWKADAANGDARSQYLLGECYLDGLGVEKDVQQALAWLEKSSAQKNKDACETLASIYEDGKLVPRDINRSAILYWEANDYRLDNLISRASEKGEKIDGFLKYMEDEAGKGNKKAMETLANCYCYGYGVKKDLRKAKELIDQCVVDNGENLTAPWLQSRIQAELDLEDKIQKAKNGNVDAMYQVYTIYENRYEEEESVEYLKMAAENGHAKAQEKMGLHYLNLDIEDEKAFELLSKAAAQGETFGLGLAYYLGDYTPFIYEKAIALLENSISKSEDEMQTSQRKMQLAVLYLTVRDHRAFDILNEVDPEGFDIECSYYKSLCYKYGVGVKKDLKKMEKCLEDEYGPSEYANEMEKHDAMAERLTPKAMGGNVDAQLELGTMYWNDLDLENAAKFLQMAADKGNPEACYLYGKLMEGGMGTAKDTEKGRALIEKAAESGYHYAQTCLGRRARVAGDLGTDKNLYYAGISCMDAKETQKAFGFFSQSAQKGNADAAMKMAQCYRYGQGTPQDLAKAVELYTKACNNGNDDATYELARLYYTGSGVPQDKEKAKQMLKPLVDKQHMDATWFVQFFDVM